MTTKLYPTLDDLVRLQFEAHGFSWLPKQPVHSLLSGRHASRLRGRGLTFEELRDYRPGDDIRAMDWRATARLRRPHVRVYSEERERPVLLVVDQRSGMFFGSARTTKATAAAELAALGAWRALSVGDRVGAVLFGDDALVQIRPHRSRRCVLHLCHQLVQFGERLSASAPPAEPTMLNEALRRAAEMAKHDNLVVLITDYDGDDAATHERATQLAAHNDVLAALIYDPLGIQLPATAPLDVTDGKQSVTIHTGPDFQTGFREAFQRRADQIRARMRSLRIPVLPICTHEPIVDQLKTALGPRR